MGQSISSIEYLLLWQKKKNIMSGKNMLMLGRQSLRLSFEEFNKILKLTYHKKFAKQDVQKLFSEVVLGCKGGGYSEGIFKFISAIDNPLGQPLQRIESMDAHPYEHATIIKDLNLTLEEKYKEKFDFVLDGETCEHVYDCTEALKSAMEMVKIGGWLCLMTPSNNMCNHGFYQFSPDLFKSILVSKNGFSLQDISALVLNGKQEDRNVKWIKIKNSNDVNYLNTIQGKGVLLFILAKKINHTPDDVTIMQPTYSKVWQEADISKKSVHLG